MIIPKQQVDVLIKNGQAAGLSGKEVLDGLVKRGYQPEGVDINAVQQATSTIGSRIGTDIQQRGSNVQEAITGTGQYAGEKPLQRGLEATAQAFGAIPSTIYNVLPEKVRGALDKVQAGVGSGVNEVVDAMASTPSLIKWTQDHPEAAQKLSEVLANVAPVGEIAGSIAIADGTAKLGNNIIDTGANLANKGVESSKNLIGSTKNLESVVKTNTNLYPKELVNTITDKITTLDPKVKNILETTSIEKFNNYVKMGEQAKADPRLLTPLEQAGEKINTQVLPSIKSDLNNIGAQKAKSLASVANVQVPNASLDAIKFIKDATKNAKLTAEENKLIKATINELELGKSPTLGTLDKTVDLLQNTLFEKSKGLAIPVTSRVESIVNQTIGKLNNTVKEAASKALGSNEYTILNDAYATKIDLFNKINKALGEDAAKGGSLIKKFFSPQDGGTKNLFAEVKAQYGIDLAEDATLAKFVMDSLGDTRAGSFLEQIPKSQADVVTKVLRAAENKLTNPIGKAKRVIEKRDLPKK